MHAALLLMAALTATDRVVVVTATSGFRHDSSIAAGEALIAAIAPSMGLDVTFVREEDEMAAALDADALRGVKMVMFVNTTGNLKHRGALLEWIRNGGSFIGVHAASDTWHEWPEYIEMLGGEFDRHPDQTTVDILVDERGHPSTNALEPPIHVFEEIYIFRNFELDRVRILLSLRQSPEDLSPGFFPMAWFKTYGSGRVFYTALGHRDEIWAMPWFQQHLRGAMTWGLRRDMVPRRRAVTAR